MIEITEYAPRAVEVKLRGPLKGADIEKLENALAPYAADEGAVSAVIDLSGDWGMEARLVHNARFMDRLMHQIDKFARIAVVGTAQMQSRIMQTVDRLMPEGSMMQFEPARVSEARAFAAYLARPEKV